MRVKLDEAKYLSRSADRPMTEAPLIVTLALRAERFRPFRRHAAPAFPGLPEPHPGTSDAVPPSAGRARSRGRPVALGGLRANRALRTPGHRPPLPRFRLGLRAEIPDARPSPRRPRNPVGRRPGRRRTARGSRRTSPSRTRCRPIAPSRSSLSWEATFEPFRVAAAGLILWRYLGGPWERIGFYPFVGKDG